MIQSQLEESLGTLEMVVFSDRAESTLLMGMSMKVPSKTAKDVVMAKCNTKVFGNTTRMPTISVISAQKTKM